MTSRLIAGLAVAASLVTATASARATAVPRPAAISALTTSEPVTIRLTDGPQENLLPAAAAWAVYLVVTSAAVSYAYHEMQAHDFGSCLTAGPAPELASEAVFDVARPGAAP